MAIEQIKPLRLERLPDVCARVGVKKSTLYKWIAERKFPAPARIGSNTVAWDARAVDRWISDRIAVSRGAA